MKLSNLIKEAEVATSHWCITISKDRYNGSYSGGNWLAFAGAPYAIDHGPWESDIPCMDFWKSRKSAKIGRGVTPKLAILDLIDRHLPTNSGKITKRERKTARL